MTKEKPFRRPIRKVLGFLIGVIVVASATFFVWIDVVARRRWAEMERGVQELADEARREQVPREPLRTPSVPGDGWVHYSSALRKFGPLVPRREREWLLPRPPKIDRSLIQVDLDAAAGALEDLRKGARSREILPHPERDDPGREYSRSVPKEISRLATWGGRLLAEGGRSTEALDLLLDVAQFGRDTVACRGGRAFSEAVEILEEALEEIRDQLVLRTWGGEDLGKLTNALEVLDRSFPSEDAAIKEALAEAGAWLLVEDPVIQISLGGEIGRRAMSPGWRHAFSMRLYKANAFLGWRTAISAPHSPKDRWMLVTRECSSNEIASLGARYFFYGSRSAGCRARLRLLRVAAAFMQGAELPDLADPFGGRLRIVRSNGHLKVWSVGTNGLDDGGRGPWKRRDRPEESVGTPDIVFEVER